jgi:transposase
VHRRTTQPHARFRNLARRLRRHFDAITAVELCLSNGLLESINGKIRLIQRRGHCHLGHLTAAIYVCLGGITINPAHPQKHVE